MAESSPKWHVLADKPLHRHVLRTIMVLAILGLWPLLRQLGARSWADLGLTPVRGQWPKLVAGLALGFATLACAAVLALLCGARQLDGGLAGSWWGRLPGIAMTAVVIGVLEELLYRGALFGVLARVWNWKIALVVSSVIYSGAHFLRHVESPTEVHWWSGLMLLPQMFGGLARMDLLIPGGIGLFIAGMVLGLAYQRTGNLYFSMGLHAGWVFWLRSYNYMTDRSPDSAVWLWGTGKLYDGWAALIALALTGVLVWKIGQSRFLDPNASQPA